MIAPPSGPLDRRVTKPDGTPVRQRQAVSGPEGDNGGWWFRVQRPQAGPGVVLVTSIPGFCRDRVEQYAAQEDADAAAAAAYDRYRADVESALDGAVSATREAS